MKTRRHEWTPQQAITLYLTIEALLSQFEAENAAKVAKREPNTHKPE